MKKMERVPTLNSAYCSYCSFGLWRLLRRGINYQRDETSWLVYHHDCTLTGESQLKIVEGHTDCYS